jgi:hypothetical protein
MCDKLNRPFDTGYESVGSATVPTVSRYHGTGGHGVPPHNWPAANSVAQLSALSCGRRSLPQEQIPLNIDLLLDQNDICFRQMLKPALAGKILVYSLISFEIQCVANAVFYFV